MGLTTVYLLLGNTSRGLKGGFYNNNKNTHYFVSVPLLERFLPVRVLYVYYGKRRKTWKKKKKKKKIKDIKFFYAKITPVLLVVKGLRCFCFEKLPGPAMCHENFFWRSRARSEIFHRFRFLRLDKFNFYVISKGNTS